MKSIAVLLCALISAWTVHTFGYAIPANFLGLNDAGMKYVCFMGSGLLLATTSCWFIGRAFSGPMLRCQPTAKRWATFFMSLISVVLLANIVNLEWRTSLGSWLTVSLGVQFFYLLLDLSWFIDQFDDYH